jgi:hypothetical protein
MRREVVLCLQGNQNRVLFFSQPLIPFIMIVRITKLVLDNTPIKFSPFVMDIPDVEIGWDRGYDYMENLIDDLFNEQMCDQGITEYKEFEFAYDFDYEIICS